MHVTKTMDLTKECLIKCLQKLSYIFNGETDLLNKKNEKMVYKTNENQLRLYKHLEGINKALTHFL